MRLYAAKALEALYIEMRAAGYKDVSVTSAYRSYSYQNSLFNMYTANEMKADPSLTLAQAQAITATYSARPGTSEHQTGLCCDMHNLSSADVAFAKKAAYTWLKDNAWKFGFILRFPEGKEDITGISFEPWHYRFVGRYHAKAIYDAGLCLEEYLTPAGN
jgi:D-alanyl-D-alanine carboxypeptidase